MDLQPACSSLYLRASLIAVPHYSTCFRIPSRLCVRGRSLSVKDTGLGKALVVLLTRRCAAIKTFHWRMILGALRSKRFSNAGPSVL